MTTIFQRAFKKHELSQDAYIDNYNVYKCNSHNLNKITYFKDIRNYLAVT